MKDSHQPKLTEGKRIAMDVLFGMGMKHLFKPVSGYDIDWHGKTVNVRTSTLRNKNGGKKTPSKSWEFQRFNKLVDYYFLICKDRGFVLHTYLVPTEKIHGNKVSIGVVSERYAKYEIK